MDEQQLTPEQVEEAGLPVGGCCCPEHPHDWYRRTHNGATWLECCACGDGLAA